MKIIATAFSLTLGAWRVRLSLDIEDAPDDRPLAAPSLHHIRQGDRARERAES